MILILNPANSDSHKAARDMLEALARVLFSLKSKARQLLTLWLSQLPPDVLGGRCIRPLQRHLSTYIEVRPFGLHAWRSLLHACARRLSQEHCVCGCETANRMIPICI